MQKVLICELFGARRAMWLASVARFFQSDNLPKLMRRAMDRHVFILQANTEGRVDSTGLLRRLGPSCLIKTDSKTELMKSRPGFATNGEQGVFGEEIPSVSGSLSSIQKNAKMKQKGLKTFGSIRARFCPSNRD